MAAATRRRPAFQVVSSDEAGVRVIAVRGELEVVTAPRLEEHLAPAASRGQPVLVDLCEVPFMDSTGIHVLVAAHENLGAAGATLAVACIPAGPPKRVLELSGVERVVPVFPSRREGVLALSDQAGRGSPIQYRGPAPRAAARSSGLASLQRPATGSRSRCTRSARP